VRLAPVANGICATDRELLTGRLAGSQPPLVPGHEIVARVVETGAPGLAVGATVVVDTMLGCGRCDPCLAGRVQLCRSASEIGLSVDGGWRDELVVPARNCHVIPRELSPPIATLVEPLQCQLGAIRRLKLAPADRVLVVGSGVAALLYVQLARLEGAEVTLSVDDDARGDLGRRLGADAVVGPSATAAAAAFTHAIDAVGSESALAEAVDALEPGGHLVAYGLGSARPRFPLQDAIFKNLTITGHTSAPWLWPDAIALAASGRLSLDPLVTDKVEFEAVGDWIGGWLRDGGLHGNRIKAVVDHGR
jgi:L-gulonate 5-dehydrogenase